MSRERFPALFVLLYFGIVAIFFQIAVVMAKHSDRDLVFQEGGFAEDVQFACVVISGILLFLFSRRFPAQSGVLTLLATLCFLAAVRELNNTEIYRIVFGLRGTSWIFGIILLGTVIAKYRRVLKAQIFELLQLPASSVFCAAFVIIVVWAQVLAQRPLFPSRESDRLVEEALEMAGYLLIVCGVVELFLNLRSAGPNEDRSRTKSKSATVQGQPR